MSMTREQIRELAEFQDENSCAVSFYFQPSTPRNKAHKEDTILIKDLAREAMRDAREQRQKRTCAGPTLTASCGSPGNCAATARMPKRFLPARPKYLAGIRTAPDPGWHAAFCRPPLSSEAFGAPARSVTSAGRCSSRPPSRPHLRSSPWRTDRTRRPLPSAAAPRTQ